MAITDITGGSLTGVTVKLKLLVPVRAPSLIVKLRFVKPFCVLAGDMVAVQFGAVPLNVMLDVGKSVVFEEVADRPVVQLKVLSTSVIVKLITAGIFSDVVAFAIVEIIGASLTGTTVKVNPVVVVFVPSVTEKTKFVLPLRLAAEVNKAVQFGAAPLNAIPATGKSVEFDEVALTDVLQFKVLSTSLIVKFTAKAMSSLVDCAPIAEMIGG